MTEAIRAEAIEQATPISAWQPASAPETEPLVFAKIPMRPATKRPLIISLAP